MYFKGAPDVRHASTREARKICGPFLVSRFRFENYWGVRRFDYFEKLRSMYLEFIEFDFFFQLRTFQTKLSVSFSAAALSATMNG